MAALADIRDIIRGALSSLFGFGGRLVARAILMVVAGRWFGMSELGVLGQVAAITEITAAIGVLGLKRSLLDMLSHKQEHGMSVEKRVVEALILSTGVAFILSGLLYFVWPVFVPEITALKGLLFFAVPAIVFTEVALSAIKFKRVIKWDVLSRGFAEPWGFLVLAIVIYQLGLVHTGLVMAYVGSILISVCTVGFGLVQTYKLTALRKAHPSMKTMLSLPKQSAPTGLTDLGVMMLRRVDILVLGLFVPTAGTGIYYMVQQLATIPQKVNSLFEPMTSPVLARLHNQFNTDRIRASLQSVCRWIFIIQLAMSVPMIVYGDSLLSIFGPAFAIGSICLTFILIAELIDGSFITTETALLYAYPKIPPIIIIFGLLLEIIAIAILSHFWGVNGAALGFLIAIIMITAGRLFMLKKKMSINVLGTMYLLPLGFALLMAICLYGLRVWFGVEHVLYNLLWVGVALTGYAYLIRTFALMKSDKILWRAFTHKKTNKRPVS